MKTNWLKRSFALLAGMAAITACSSDNDNGGSKEPEFPEMQRVEIAAGDTKTLTFRADAAWKLTIDKTWCRFVDGDIETAQLQGAAGSQTIHVLVKDLNQNFESATAKIELSMGAQIHTVFEVIRPSLSREVKMYELSGWGESRTIEEINKVGLTFDIDRAISNDIGFTANFDWKVLSVSEGFEMTMLSGVAGASPENEAFVTTYVSMSDEDKDKLPYAANGQIIVSDLNGGNQVAFEIEYPGMGDEDICFIPANFTSAPMGSTSAITFAIDGYVFSKGYDPQPTEEKDISCRVLTKEMKYKTFVVELTDGNRPVVAADSWLKAEDNGSGDITLSVAGDGTNAGEPRFAYFFVLPEKLAATPDFDSYFESGQLAYGCEYGIEVTQKGTSAAQGFAVSWGVGGPVPTENIIPFSESVLGEDMKPGEMFYSAPEGNTYVYTFTDDDIAGLLAFGPLGTSDEYYPFPEKLYRLSMPGDFWDVETNMEHTSAYLPGYASSVNGIGIIPEDLRAVEGGMLGVFFYETAEQKENYQPFALLILVKAGTR